MSLLSKFLEETSSIFFKDYQIQSKLATGGSSEIYLAEPLKSDSSVIIKSPFFSKNSGTNLLKEANLMLQLKDVTGVPQILESIVNENCEALIIQRLGQSLDMLVKEYMNFSLKTVIMVAKQMIATLQRIHGKAIIHRDIKPGNILISKNSNSKQIFLIDYGLAKKFLNSKGCHKLFNVKRNSFKGTLMFASRNTHFGYSNSRRDDLESLGYTLVYLYKGFLPWSNWHKSNLDVRSLGKIKNQCYAQGVFADLPLEFKQFFDYVGKLKYEDVPDYDFLIELFNDMAKRYEFDMQVHKWEWTDESCSETSFNDSMRKSNEDEFEKPCEKEIDDESFFDSFNTIQRNLLVLNINPMGIRKFSMGNSKSKELKQLKNKFQKLVLQK